MKRMLLAGLVLAMGALASSAAAYEEIVVTDGGELTGTVKLPSHHVARAVQTARQ